MKKIFILITVIILLSSCDTTAPDRFENEYLVISGFLQAGKNISLENPIFVGKTIPTEGGSMEDILILDAEVILIDIAEEDTFALSFAFSINPNENTTLGYVSENVIIEAAKTYRLEVRAIIDSQAVYAWAETTVPSAVNIDVDYNGLAASDYGFADEYSFELPEIPYDNVNDDFPIHFELNNGDILYTSYNFYCLEDFSPELEYTMPFMDFTHLEPEDEEAYNSMMSNNIRESNMIWRYEPQQDSLGNWFRLDEFYAGGFNYFARYRLTIYIIDENYYTYRYHSQSYFHGGINGGIGYFGSVTGEDYYTKIIK